MLGMLCGPLPKLRGWVPSHTCEILLSSYSLKDVRYTHNTQDAGRASTKASTIALWLQHYIMCPSAICHRSSSTATHPCERSTAGTLHSRHTPAPSRPLQPLHPHGCTLHPGMHPSTSHTSHNTLQPLLSLPPPFPSLRFTTAQAPARPAPSWLRPLPASHRSHPTHASTRHAHMPRPHATQHNPPLHASPRRHRQDQHHCGRGCSQPPTPATPPTQAHATPSTHPSPPRFTAQAPARPAPSWPRSPRCGRPAAPCCSPPTRTARSTMWRASWRRRASGSYACRGPHRARCVCQGRLPGVCVCRCVWVEGTGRACASACAVCMCETEMGCLGAQAGGGRH